MNVCSMFRSVVGVSVGVVLVGTPEFNPSRVINWKKKKRTKSMEEYLQTN